MRVNVRSAVTPCIVSKIAGLNLFTGVIMTDITRCCVAFIYDWGDTLSLHTQADPNP